VIRHNPAREVALPHRPSVEVEGDEGVRVFTREQLGEFLKIVHPRHRMMFRLLAATGLRWSELTALQWQHFELNGSRPHVKVRRGIVRGVVGPPKSRHGKRDVPIDSQLVSELRSHRAAADDSDSDALAFPSSTGTPLDHTNTLRRILRPVAEEVGAPWAGFHTFRHTCASILFESGRNAKQVQRWLGHHSASFTLDTYVHLLRDDAEEPLPLDAELKSGNTVGTEATETHRNEYETHDSEPTLVAARFTAQNGSLSGIAVGG
jgi:integrase